MPNSLVVSRGCPHVCDFCYKEAFFRGGRSFYVQAVDDALAEIDRLPGRHLYFLDDNLFGSPPFAEALFDGLKGMGRLWQAAGTVEGVLRPGLLEKAVESGLRSLFIGFETLSAANLRGAGKTQNLAGAGATEGAEAASGAPQYDAAVRRLHDLGVMVNGAFVFGMDHDDPSVFARTVDWAVSRGVETATFHIMTPYPGTRLERRLAAEGRVTSRDWDLYDTRHAVFTPAGMTAGQLEAGYWGAYRDFYRWSSIWRAAFAHGDLREHARHLAYTSGWKKLEPMWDWAIRSGQVHRFLPLLETILDRFGSGGGAMPGRLRPPARSAGGPAGSRPSAVRLRVQRRPSGRFLSLRAPPQLAGNRSRLRAVHLAPLHRRARYDQMGRLTGREQHEAKRGAHGIHGRRQEDGRRRHGEGEAGRGRRQGEVRPDARQGKDDGR